MRAAGGQSGHLLVPAAHPEPWGWLQGAGVALEGPSTLWSCVGTAGAPALSLTAPGALAGAASGIPRAVWLTKPCGQER